MAALSVDDLVRRLRSRDVRMTGPRRAVLAALVARGSHVTADELHRFVLESMPDVSASSVYRTMDLLTEHGIVDHVHLGHGPAEYHLRDDVHAHLVCDDCGDVVELDGAVSGPFTAAVRDALGFEVDLRHFALTGRCRACHAGASAAGATPS